jgi:hypothetical protein
MGGSNNHTFDNNRNPVNRDQCPARVTGFFPDPGGLVVGDDLSIILDGGAQPRVVLTTQTGVKLGSLAGVPDLQRLITCLQDGKAYTAKVDKIDSGAVVCVLKRVNA